MSKRGAEVGDVPNEEGMDITMADSEPMLRRGDVGYEEQVSKIQRKVLHRRYTGIVQDLEEPSFFSYDTEAPTTPRCARVLQKIPMATAGAGTREEEFEESEVVDDSGYIYAIREQLGRKRSFDQIATYGELTSSESPVKMSLSSMNGPAQPSPEKLPVVIASHDGLSENISSHSNLVSGLAEKSAEKSDVELSNERPLMNVQQELVAPSNTILFLHNPLQQSLPMGGIPFIVFPTAGGIPVAPAPTAGNNALNTVPAQQSLEMPILPTSNNPGLQTALQASTLTPQLQSLHISSASSQQPQNIVTSEASLLGSSEALTTVDTTEISQQLSLTGAEGDRTDVEGGQQETENFISPNQEEPNVEKTDSSQVPEKESAEAIALAGDQESSGLSTLQMSDLAPLLSEDSGFGTSEKLEENTSQAIHVALAGAATRGDTYAKNVMLLKNEDLAQRDGKILMPTTIEMVRTRKTGQCKKQVQFSKSMSEDAVRKKIQETFAFDLSVRFSCASISNTDSTLQFHGDPRVWDGKTIRRILKGNSALYIVMEEIQNGLDMLSNVALAVKEQEEGDKDSGFLLNRVPIEERMDVEMASETLLEKDRIEPLSSEDLSEKLEDMMEIFPKKGPIEGGLSFLLVFGQSLPPEVESSWADFGMKTVADLKRVNDFNLIGRIPASDKPGKVTVTVYSSTGGILGKTDFDYCDQDKETLLRLVKDPKLQSEFFCHWADFMVDKTKRSEGQDLSEPLAGPSCTGYLGDEESLSDKSSGSESSFSEDNSSTASSEDLDENPTSEECCGPEGVAKYEGKNEAKEESLTKTCTDLVGEDPIRLEPKPKVNEQERGGSSSEEEFFPGEHELDVGNLCSIARESQRQNIQQQNSGCNFDQSSIAEKTRRAKERNNEEETGDLNGAPLWQKQNKPTI